MLHIKVAGKTMRACLLRTAHAAISNPQAVVNHRYYGFVVRSRRSAAFQIRIPFMFFEETHLMTTPSNKRANDVAIALPFFLLHSYGHVNKAVLSRLRVGTCSDWQQQVGDGDSHAEHLEGIALGEHDRCLEVLGRRIVFDLPGV